MSGTNTLFRPDMLVPPPQNGLAPQPTWADAWQFNSQAVQDEIARQQAISEQRGLWNPETGLPTQAGVVDAAQQYAQGVLMGTTAPGERGFSLEQVHPRTLRPLPNEPDMAQPGKHAFSIKDPAGEPVGIVDTEWNPETGGLHIADFQSNEGPQSLGLAAVRQIRDQLLARYPGVRSLSGQRITGAVSADHPSGSGPGRAATQVVRDQ